MHLENSRRTLRRVKRNEDGRRTEIRSDKRMVGVVMVHVAIVVLVLLIYCTYVLLVVLLVLVWYMFYDTTRVR